jgi:hypothetical protein
LKEVIDMAYTVKINNNYELFGLTNDSTAEILDAIENHMGWEFAQFVKDNLIESPVYDCLAGLEDIIYYCDTFDEETDKISDTLNDIKLTAETCQSELNKIV